MQFLAEPSEFLIKELYVLKNKCMLYLMRLTQEYRKLKEATTKSPPIKIVENTADISSKIHIKVNYSEGKSTSLADRSNIPR